VGAGELRSNNLISLEATIFIGSQINLISNALTTSPLADIFFVDKRIAYLLETTKFGLELCHLKLRFFNFFSLFFDNISLFFVLSNIT